MKLQDLTKQFHERAIKHPDRSLFLTDKQVAFALSLAHKEGLDSLPINHGYIPLPGSRGRYIFRAN